MTWVEVINQRVELVGFNRDLLARLKGPDFRHLVSRLVEASGLERLEGTGDQRAALEADGTRFPKATNGAA